MAEFLEVMRQANRMCKECDCTECPMYDVDVLDECILVFYNEYTTEDLLDIEQRIVQWAKENREPQYPTWKEWVETRFPTAEDEICPHIFMSADEWARFMGMERCHKRCSQCMDTPIPADIAKKLGIRPKEV